MKPVHSFVVSARLPERIARLKELCYNYWWCWNTESKELFIRMNRTLWDEVNHNPVLFINKIPQESLQKLAEQSEFVHFLDFVYRRYEDYMKAQTWFAEHSHNPKEAIAYFSMEYGINESLPVYSGGLGVLAGDHMKSASDLGLPMVGVGLIYQQGYFRQYLTQNGWQNEFYEYNDFFSMPLTLMKQDNGDPIIIDVDLPFGKAFAQIWKLNIGRIHLYYLDTNIEQNSNEEYRNITDQLYGGTRETRIQQEVLLGIGGMRALKALGIDPAVVHINEGHAAFALLERTKMFMEKFGLDFMAAKQITRASSVFTTHTPVPAGNEAFSQDRLDRYLASYSDSLGIDRNYFKKLGLIGDYNPDEPFSMTVLGLKLTSFHNGVSKLHGKVARNMWHQIWKCFPAEEVPIRYITNGIHTNSWVARDFGELYDRYLGPNWRTDTDNQEVWDQIDNIPNEELWREKQRRRVRLVLFAREYLKKNQKGYLLPNQMGNINEFLDPDALTIGFARRFATYKRALMIFTDMEKLAKIMKDPDRPVQLILSGKAHPHDQQGKEVIQSIIQKVRAYDLEKHVVFLEDYDMDIARYMVKGCDVWLNNPIRPMEASGTSGMKAALNGTLNFSVPDGWWDEAYDGTNGFAIGEGEMYSNPEEQDIIESQALYDILAQVIVPMFYERGANRAPDTWIQFMKNSIRTIAGRFSTHRMLKEYCTEFYFPAAERYKSFMKDNARLANDFRYWKQKVRDNWSLLEIIDV
ncbi:MAG: alpha-glucan family phosphorylase, partial [Bacteroidota bacterium]